MISATAVVALFVEGSLAACEGPYPQFILDGQRESAKTTSTENTPLSLLSLVFKPKKSRLASQSWPRVGGGVKRDPKYSFIRLPIQKQDNDSLYPPPPPPHKISNDKTKI